MNSQNRIIIAIIAVIILAGGLFWLLSANQTATPSSTSEPSETTEPTNGDIAAVITYDGTSFSLTTTKVAAGTQVRVFNDSDEALTFSSDPHPTHTDNPELNAGDIAPGESKTFTLNTKGAWGFHNHLNARQRGSITVE